MAMLMCLRRKLRKSLPHWNPVTTVVQNLLKAVLLNQPLTPKHPGDLSTLVGVEEGEVTTGVIPEVPEKMVVTPTTETREIMREVDMGEEMNTIIPDETTTEEIIDQEKITPKVPLKDKVILAMRGHRQPRRMRNQVLQRKIWRSQQEKRIWKINLRNEWIYSVYTFHLFF